MKCECPYTLKVPLGNAFQVLFPVKTAEWKDGERTVEVADVRALTDIVVKVDGDEWEQGWEMDERGPLVNFPKDSLAKGPHNVEITADYFGVASALHTSSASRWCNGPTSPTSATTSSARR